MTVDGSVATLGDRVDPSRSRVEVDGSSVNLDPNARYYALHKPVGVVTTMRDPQGRPDLRTLMPATGPRIFPVGRLDRDSEGLLILTNDGDLGNRLLHPKFQIEKEYLVEVTARPTARHVAGLRAGVDLDDGHAAAKAVRIVDARRDRGALRIVMTEGRKREVRRMLADVGLPVRRLVRMRIGPIVLGNLAPGQVRELTPAEIGALARAVDR